MHRAVEQASQISTASTPGLQTPVQREVGLRSIADRLRLFWRLFGRGAPLILWLLSLAIYLLTTPSFTNGKVIGDSSAAIAEMPFLLQKAGSEQTLNLTYAFRLRKLHPSKFKFYAGYSLLSLSINGADVSLPAEPIGWCELGGTLNLAHYLKPGTNVIAAEIQPSGSAAFWIDVAPTDWSRLILYTCMLGALISTVAQLVKICPLRKLSPVCVAILVFGAALRLFYFWTTAPFTRCYDFAGHIEYLEYLLTHGSIPPAHFGWQTYQPPVYYVISAFGGKLVELLGGNRMQQFLFWQSEGLIISLLVLLLAFWIAVQCFPKLEQKWQRNHLLAGVALFPAVVMYSSRISNDSLFSLVMIRCSLWFRSRGLDA